MKKLFSTLLAMALILSVAAIPTMAATTYNLKGILPGERILLNEELGRNLSVVTASLTSQSLSEAAAGIEKVVFKSNGNVVETDDDGAPFDCFLKFEKIGENNTVTAEIYDSTDALIQTISVNYHVLMATNGTGKSYNYESELGAFDSNATATLARVEDPDDANNHLLSILSPIGTTKRAYFLDGTNAQKVTFGNTNIMHVEFDFNRGASLWNKLTLYLKDAPRNQTYATALTVAHNNETIFKRDTWYHVEIILDKTNGTFVTFVDGKELFRGTKGSGYTKSTIILEADLQSYDNKTAYPVYIDNLKIQTYATDATESFGVFSGGGEFDNLSGTSAEVDVAVVNTSGTAKEFINIVAVYDSNDALISATLDTGIAIPDDGVSYKIYNPSLIGSNGEQGTKVKVFTWDSLGTLVPVGSFK